MSSFFTAHQHNIGYAVPYYSATPQYKPHCFQSSTNVELHRPIVRSPVQTNSYQHSSKAVRPSPSPSAMSNSIDQLYVSNVELHRQVVSSQWCLRSTMSNSIDSQSPVNNVELHRLSELTRPVFSLEIAVELRHGELSSCAIYTLNTCNPVSYTHLTLPTNREV